MDVTPLVKSDQQIIQSYAGGRFRVSGTTYDHAVLVSPSDTCEWTVSGPAEMLNEEDFRPLLDRAEDIDVVLLGTGAKLVFISPALKNTLKKQGLSIEAMDTGAACRTYNVLMAEGRRVFAALIPV